ncbi:helix-turn-helix domain-containing protein [Acetobacterium wieringae]|uniref:Helix-turn-helix domain-containing protein n=1 Tax=Acetobacterium wieringae TaxID=52694 RepID=A0ABY6HE28_9FIRM|nr:helix-turn-helix transcriptional regulator [Acetobacterium wieringae]UYO61861.1 helix-turn-helix domain-containing protein [Acetobacterium wieringae]
MNRIKELRTKKGITQAELAKKIGVQGAAISKYENEQLQISNEVLKSLALIFEVSIDYILYLTDDPTPVRGVNQDLYDEQDASKELEALMADEPLRTEFQDYDEWSEEEKRNLLNFIKGQKALKKINEKK